MNDLDNVIGQFDDALLKAKEMVDSASDIDFDVILQLTNFLPDLEDLINPIVDFLKDLIDDLVRFLDMAFQGLKMVINQIRKLQILERFSSILYKGLDVLGSLLNSINSLSDQTVIDFGSGNEFMNQFEKVNEFMQKLFDQIPTDDQLNIIKVRLAELKNGLTSFKAQLI